LERLGHFEIFKCVKDVRPFFYFVHEKVVTKNEIVYKSGDKVDGIYLVVQGQIDILNENG